MKVSKGQSQPEIVADIRLSISLHGSGFTIFVPGLDCDSLASRMSEAKNYLSLGLHDEVEESDDVPFSGMKRGSPARSGRIG